MFIEENEGDEGEENDSDKGRENEGDEGNENEGDENDGQTDRAAGGQAVDCSVSMHVQPQSSHPHTL